ncbi:hypothetical protein ACLOAV_004650 [Pseudogymnoascus australis]
MTLLPLPIPFSHGRSYCLDSISEQDSNLIELVKCYLHTLPADEVISRIVSITDRVIVEAEFDRRQNEILNRIQRRLSLYTDDELYRRNGLEYRQSRRTRSAERRISGLWRSYRYRPEVADFRTNWLAAKEQMQDPSVIEKEFEIWQTEILIIENIANAEDWELLDGDQDGQAFTNFTNFLDLPTDLRLKIWSHAFPPQTVNVIYDPGQHRFLLLGSPPVLPQIHRETREFYLQTHTLSLGTKTHAASMNFDPVGDILMYSWFPNDDTKTGWPSGEPLSKTHTIPGPDKTSLTTPNSTTNPPNILPISLPTTPAPATPLNASTDGGAGSALSTARPPRACSMSDALINTPPSDLSRALGSGVEDARTPYLQMIAKGLGGGYQPIAGVIIGKEVIAVVGSGTGGFIHGQTYQAHPVACAASLAVQRIIRREGLLPNVQKQGVYLSQLLQNKLGSHRNVGDIRGKGLFWGIEFVQNKETKVPFRKALNVANKISEMALKDFKITLYPGQGTENGVDGDHICFKEYENPSNWGSQPKALLDEALQPTFHTRVLGIYGGNSPYSFELFDQSDSSLPFAAFSSNQNHMDSNRREEVQQVQDALRNSKEAQEAVSTLMDGPLHWSLNPIISGVIFRVASTYRMLMEAESTTNATESSFLGCNPEWAIDVIKEVSKTTAFNAWCHELPVMIHLTDLPEAICDAFGSLISFTLLATENKRLKLRKSELLGALEESEWLDAERESHALWHEYEEIITELDIDHQTNRLNQLHRLITKGIKKMGQEKQLDTEKENTSPCNRALATSPY